MCRVNGVVAVGGRRGRRWGQVHLMNLLRCRLSGHLALVVGSVMELAIDVNIAQALPVAAQPAAALS